MIVYTLALGLPLGFAIWGREWLMGFMGTAWYWIPLLIMTVFATTGPFVYLFLQHRAEEGLLKREREIQKLLKDASNEMTAIRRLPELLHNVVGLLSVSLKLRRTGVYLLRPDNDYHLSASRPREEAPRPVPASSAMVAFLKEKKYPLVYEELKYLSDDEQKDDLFLREAVAAIESFNARIVIPMIGKEVLVGFIILGESADKEMYSSELIEVLSVLGRQAALAVDNALYYEETGKGLAERFHESRLRSLGTLEMGLAHQINNRFNVIAFAGESALKSVRSAAEGSAAPEKLKEIFAAAAKNLERIIDSAFRGSEVTNAIKNYAKKMDTKPSAVLFKEAVQNSLALILVKQHDVPFRFIEDYPPETTLWGNFSNLQEVIFNALDNSCDAMREKQAMIAKGELSEQDYAPQITVRGRAEGGQFKFEIEDNGIGFDDARLQKGVEEPFATTKGADKGSGMGLYMMSYYVRQNGGDLKVESEYGKFSKIIITLPIADKKG